jgi:hypothetical protein
MSLDPKSCPHLTYANGQCVGCNHREPKEMTVKVGELKPGDFVIAAKATVKETQSFASVTIVDFTDKTATAPIPSHAPVQITRIHNAN